MNRDEVPQLMTAKEAAKRLGISDKHFSKLVGDGAIRYIAIGSGTVRARRRYAPADLTDFIDKRRRVAPPKLPPPEPRRRRRASNGMADDDGYKVDFAKLREELRLKKASQRRQP